MIEATPLRAVIGAQLRRWREEELRTQDEFARIAAEAGLRWRRATVASVEAGTREISAGELVLLSIICRRPLPWWIDTEDNGAELINVTDDRPLPVASIARALAGELVERSDGIPIIDILEAKALTRRRDAPETQARRQQIDAAMAKWGPKRHPRSWAASLADLFIIEAGGQSDAEIKAARRLGLTPLEVAAVALRLWDHSLTTERDLRVDPRSHDAPDPEHEFDDPVPTPPSVRALRGHVTRQLIQELRDAITEMEMDQ